MSDQADATNARQDSRTMGIRPVNLPPFPCPDSGGWLLPMSPGEAHGVALREAIRLRSEAHGDNVAVSRRGIDRLEQLGVVTHWEGELLRDLLSIVGRQGEPRDTYRAVLALHQKLLDSHDRGWVATTITGVAVDSVAGKLTAQEGTPLARNVASADVQGAIGGAGVGASLGGIWGAVIGAAEKGATRFSKPDGGRA